MEVNANKGEGGFWILGRLYVGVLVATLEDGEMRLSTSRIFANEDEAQKYIDWSKAGNPDRKFFVIAT